MTPQAVYINGRFLSQSVSGVQRYGREILHALDHLLATGSDPDLSQATWTLLVPGNAVAPLAPFQAIRTLTGGAFGGHAWDQISLPSLARGGALLSLTSSGPVLHRRHLVVIHDAAVYRHPEHFSPAYRHSHRTVGHLLAKSAQIATVSEFSRSELAEVLHVDPQRIIVAPNGGEHLQTVQPDDSIIEKLGLQNAPFFLAVGNLTKNKNLGIAVQAIQRIEAGNASLVAVGSVNERIFGASEATANSRVLFPGRLSDGAVASLMRHARALVFPSIYEGFGIPPLEAMANDCPVLASTAGAVREVCGDAAEYFEPFDASQLAALMDKVLQEDALSRANRIRAGRARVANYSWTRSARILGAASLALAGT